jgi:hypothetical protein
MMLAFRDPLDDEDAGGDEEPGLVVDVLPAAGLSGRVDQPVESAYGNVFAVSLRGADSLEGVRLELSGDALALFRVETVGVALRVRDGHQLETRELVPNEVEGGKLVCTLSNAFLERLDTRPPALDTSDMFATMQRLMSAGDAQQLNTMLVDVKGAGRRSGEGTLVLRASPSSAESAIAAGEASAPVRVA